MIEVRGLTKRYGEVVAVDDLTFDVVPGRVTGFLGPNGAGKSTTMRAIVGLERPHAGHVHIDGRPYRDVPRPLTTVGALLEARSTHPGRSARDHVLFLARANGIPTARVDEVLETVGIDQVARRAVGTFSLGMSQRLGIAAALLGDPRYLLFDEPVNGLDPEGIRWIRNLLRALASEGRAVLVSSHLLSEMAQTADHLVVIGNGRLIDDVSVREFLDRATRRETVVRTPTPTKLHDALVGLSVTITAEADGRLLVSGVDAKTVGEAAAAAGVVLHELTPRMPSLEEAFMELTHDSVVYAARERLGAGK